MIYKKTESYGAGLYEAKYYFFGWCFAEVSRKT